METTVSIKRLVRAAVLLALLIAWQAATAPLGVTLLTGSGVNLILAVGAYTCGAGYGALLAAVSPVMARLLGIGPMWELIPFIALGNLAFAAVWIVGEKLPHSIVRRTATAVLAALVKFLVLYFGVVRLAVPIILGLPEKQAAVISAMFSVPQLVTAAIGGVLAVILLPVLEKALREHK